MTQPRPSHAELATLLSIQPDAIMSVLIHDTHIEILTYEFKKFGLPLPLPLPIPANAQAAAPEPPVTAVANLTHIPGIGPAALALLADYGIHTVADMAQADPVQVAGLPRIGMSKAQAWVTAAKELNQ